MSLSKFIILLAILGYASAAVEMCSSNSISHCQSVGYQRCKKDNNVESCFCAHTTNWTAVTDIVTLDKQCFVSDSVYLDANYWFQDVPAANLAFILLFGIITTLYLIVISAKVCALHQKLAPDAELSYWPAFLPSRGKHNNRTFYQPIPQTGKRV